MLTFLTTYYKPEPKVDSRNSSKPEIFNHIPALHYTRVSYQSPESCVGYEADVEADVAEDSLELLDLGLELFRKLQLEELPVLAAGHHLGK